MDLLIIIAAAFAAWAFPQNEANYRLFPVEAEIIENASKALPIKSNPELIKESGAFMYYVNLVNKGGS